MRIAFDLTPIYDHLTGIERYNINITKEIIMAHPKEEYILIFKEKLHKDFEAIVNQPNVEYVTIPECNKFFLFSGDYIEL